MELKLLFMTSSTLVEYFSPKINEISLKKVDSTRVKYYLKNP